MMWCALKNDQIEKLAVGYSICASCLKQLQTEQQSKWIDVIAELARLNALIESGNTSLIPAAQNAIMSLRDALHLWQVSSAEKYRLADGPTGGLK